MSRAPLWLAALLWLAQAGAAAALTAAEVNEAAFKPGGPAREGVDPAVLRAQVLLDRLRFSPGSIDGRMGENFANALDAFAIANGLQPAGKLTQEIWDRLVGSSEGPILVPYTIAKEDVKGPFLERIPKDYEEMASLKSLGYTSPEEALGERFHVAPALLKALNPRARFEAGEEITVPAARPDPKPGNGGPKVGRIEVDKARKTVRAFDRDGKLVATYPASVGSDEKPAPSGRFEIRAIAANPTYTYNPDYAFKGQSAKKKVEIAPGPNNPVGAVWLDLTAESYGIHGTPEPERVGKTASHGCVRLTNWDVKDLASQVGKGTVVEFVE
ncbi:L,D-transpeptidase family protein [Enterovirga aerilata]|uniref:Murein L,D-transpeptidase n=1 Tax=Enterovirga aerilata TaxID=2730920 RepID=A0A849I9P9_9HYPH|nr:L,D-transpeptidase [Enterovirga sp. DB1703]NNM72800.1 murein L,D-transpeptidase [Enterovirga sp. DB1703]